MKLITSGKRSNTGAPDQVKLDGLTYQYDHSVPTDKGPDYLPDWEIIRSIKESVQNTLDEVVMSGCSASVIVHGSDEMAMTDTGHGVTFDAILITGASGKRGVAGVVGQHGEGEVVSSIVAVRSGYYKVIASQDWLALPRLALHPESTVRQVLWFDLYKSDRCRTGTLWMYRGTNASGLLAQAIGGFPLHFGLTQTIYGQAHRALLPYGGLPERKTAERYITTESGKLYSNGMLICENLQASLACGYNLSQNPGRDRSAFDLETVLPDIESLFRQYATEQHVYEVLKKASWYSRIKEIHFQTGPNETTVKAGVKWYERQYNCRICWADTRADAPEIADAEGQGNITILRFDMFNSCPAWLRAGLPHIDKLVKVNGLSESRAQFAPSAIQTVVKMLLDLMDEARCPVEYKALPQDVLGAGNGSGITLDVKKCRSMRFSELLRIVIHEAAHFTTEASDCTREHADGISNLSNRIMLAIADSPEKMRQFNRAHKNFDKWIKAAA